MLYKIHNPRPATQGIWVDGRRVMVKPGATIEREMSVDDAHQARKRVTVEAIGPVEFETKPDTFAHGFIADINRLQAAEPNPVDFDLMTDGQLRDLAKSRGIKVHHKAGRAKILEALL